MCKKYVLLGSYAIAPLPHRSFTPSNHKTPFLQTPSGTLYVLSSTLSLCITPTPAIITNLAFHVHSSCAIDTYGAMSHVLPFTYLGSTKPSNLTAPCLFRSYKHSRKKKGGSEKIKRGRGREKRCKRAQKFLQFLTTLQSAECVT